MNDQDAVAWLEWARDDLTWARITSEGGLDSRACFAAQQAAEKALIELLSLAVEFDTDFQQLKDSCDVLDQYYIASRYPLARSSESFESEESTGAIAAAEGIIEFVRSKLAVL